MRQEIIHKECKGKLVFDAFGNMKCLKCGLITKDKSIIGIINLRRYKNERNKFN